MGVSINGVVPHKWGPSKGMVYFMANLKQKWMITGGTPHSGNLHPRWMTQETTKWWLPRSWARCPKIAKKSRCLFDGNLFWLSEYMNGFNGLLMDYSFILRDLRTLDFKKHDFRGSILWGFPIDPAVSAPQKRVVEITQRSTRFRTNHFAFFFESKYGRSGQASPRETAEVAFHIASPALPKVHATANPTGIQSTGWFQVQPVRPIPKIFDKQGQKFQQTISYSLPPTPSTAKLFVFLTISK